MPALQEQFPPKCTKWSRMLTPCLLAAWLVQCWAFCCCRQSQSQRTTVDRWEASHPHKAVCHFLYFHQTAWHRWCWVFPDVPTRCWYYVYCLMVRLRLSPLWLHNTALPFLLLAVCIRIRLSPFVFHYLCRQQAFTLRRFSFFKTSVMWIWSLFLSSHLEMFTFSIDTVLVPF